MQFTTNLPESKPVEPTPIRARTVNGQEGSFQVFCDGAWRTIAYLNSEGKLNLMVFGETESDKLKDVGLHLESQGGGLQTIKVYRR